MSLQKNNSAIVHRYPGQLREDAESIERRKWYMDMEKKIFESIDEREKLYRMALSESNGNAACGVTSFSSSSNNAIGLYTPKLDMLRRMNNIEMESVNTIAVCFPGVANGYNVFQKISNQLELDNILAYGVSVNGKMHLCTKSQSKSFRKVVYSIRDDIKSLLTLTINNKKVVFIGHCFGCLIAYEVVRLLIYEKILISGMIAISSKPPIRQSKLNYEGDIPQKLHRLTDRELMKAISDLNFIPTLLLERKDLCRRMLPVIRADLKQLEDYHMLFPYLPNQNVATTEVNEMMEDTVDADELNELLDMPPSLFKITIPVYSIHGEDDIFVSEDDCKFWRLVSSVFHEHTTIPNCNHMLLHSPDVARCVSEKMQNIVNQNCEENDF